MSRRNSTPDSGGRGVAVGGEELGERPPQRLPLFAWDVRDPASIRGRLAHELLASEVNAGAELRPRLIAQAICHEAPVAFLCTGALVRELPEEPVEGAP